MHEQSMQTLLVKHGFCSLTVGSCVVQIDYVLSSLPLMLCSLVHHTGATSTTISVAVVADDEPEVDELFLVMLVDVAQSNQRILADQVAPPSHSS